MPEITIELIRRRAEHNEGLIHTLEELSLHQEELESINYTLGCNCRRLKILYLQNNIIGEMENLHHMKELEYLNLALNNISKVRGLHACEFLNKLDLTVNFVDLDELESSVSAMEGNLHLKDLYMMGNPCQAWEGFQSYVAARLPQLERLDGKEITRTDRIRAQQRLSSLREELAPLAEEVRRRKLQESGGAQEKGSEVSPVGDSDGEDVINGDCAGNYDIAAQGKDEHSNSSSSSSSSNDDKNEENVSGEEEGRRVEGEEELTKHTPEVRTAIYREMAEQKKEKEDRQKENLPKDRDFGLEQEAAIARAREREAEGSIRQCNEGKLAFRFDETTSTLQGGKRGGGEIVLDVSVPRYLDSSLIDVDVHPHYVSIIIKGKVLRLTLQAEVKAGEAKARRSKTTGSLVITMPKVDPKQSIGLLSSTTGKPTPGVAVDRAAASKNAKANDVGRCKLRRRTAPTLASVMMQEATAAATAGAAAKIRASDSVGTPPETSHQAVSIRGMVGPRHGGLAVDDSKSNHISEVTSTKRTGASADTVSPPRKNELSARRSRNAGSSSPKRTRDPNPEPLNNTNLPAPPASTREPSDRVFHAADSKCAGKREGAKVVGLNPPPPPANIPAPPAGNPAVDLVGGGGRAGGVDVRSRSGVGKGSGVGMVEEKPVERDASWCSLDDVD